MNPHMDLRRTAKPPGDAWQCACCGARGALQELRATACTAVYPPCTTCGQTPECAADCAAILALLAGQGLAVIGAPPDVAQAIDEAKARGVN